MELILAQIDTKMVFVGVAVFLAIIIGLTVIIQVAARYLTPQGNAKIDINHGFKTVETPRGTTLLNALNENAVKIASACGGGGSCGQCKCQVLSGGGEVLPSEKSHLNLKQIQEGWRLACQVKVRDDIKIHAEAGAQEWECEVVSNDNVATFIKEFKVQLPPGANLDFKAGGYIQIAIPEYDMSYKSIDLGPKGELFKGDWDKFKMWELGSKTTEACERAYSMANHPAEGNIVMLNVRIAHPPPDRNDPSGWKQVPAGKASSYIFNLKKGDKVKISGPYGEFYMNHNNREIMFIGGGAGMAPMRSHIFDLFQTQKSTRKATFWYGARSMKEMFYDEDFKSIEKEFPNFKYFVALSDKAPEDEGRWTVKKDMNDTEASGFRGFIHNVIMEQYLKNHEAPEDIDYYMCGPPIMNKSVMDMLVNLGVDRSQIHLDDFGG